MDLINANVQQGVSEGISNLREKPVSYGSSIISRETVRFYSTGSSEYNSTQNRQMTFKLSSTNYLDPATCTLNFQLQTDSRSGQVPETDFGLAMIQSCQLRAGGRIIENIDNASDILRGLFYLNNDAEVVRGIGSANGHYKFKTVRGQLASDTLAVIADDVTTALEGFGTNNTSNLVLPGPADFGTITNNNSNYALSTGHTVLPEMAAWIRGAQDNVRDNRLVSGLNKKQGRFYSVRLSDLFGLFKSTDMLPLRNLQQLEISIQLAEYSRCFINTTTYAISDVGVTSTNFDAANANTALSGYKIRAPFISADIIQASEGTVSLIDGMCASAEGFALVYDAYSTSKQSLNYSTSLSLQTSKSYSHIRDAYVFMAPTVLANGSTCLDCSQQYYGSRHQAHSITVGSSSFPLVECDSTSASYLECMKTVANHHRTDGGSIIDYNLYTGSTAYVGKVNRPFFPSLVLGASASSKTGAAAVQASCLPFETPSAFIIGQSFEKAVSKNKALSGINTRLTASQITLNLKLVDLDDATVGKTQLYSADVVTGLSPISFTVAVHYESLLLVQNNSIIVAD